MEGLGGPPDYRTRGSISEGGYSVNGWFYTIRNFNDITRIERTQQENAFDPLFSNSRGEKAPPLEYYIVGKYKLRETASKKGPGVGQ